MKKILKISTDILFIVALIASILFIPSNILKEVTFSYTTDLILLWLYVATVPATLILSLISASVWNGGRYDWYLAVSGYEIGMVVTWIIIFLHFGF